MVYVLNKFGQPLMPTKRQGKVRRWLRDGHAKVVCRSPFTVQLLFETGSETQKTTLGIDPGYEHVGVSVVTETEELFAGDFKLRTDIQSKMSDRAMYRRNRRGRKTRYRKPRFLNRKKTYSDAPSIRHKTESHLRVINLVTSILPIDRVVLEVASFDVHKIKNPDLQGVDYQNGDQKGYQNVREYVLARDGHKCHFNDKCSERLEVHHIVFRSNGGSDAPNNLITLCKKHHDQLHEGKVSLPNNLKHKSLRAATFMNTVMARLKEVLPDIDYTYGYITKQDRYKHGIEKSHANDAFVIAGGSNQKRTQVQEWSCKRKNNRQLGKLRKGFAPSSRKQRYPIQPKDLVEYAGGIYETLGSHNEGTRIIIPINGKKKSVAVKQVRIVFHQKTLLRNIA